MAYITSLIMVVETNAPQRGMALDGSTLLNRVGALYRIAARNGIIAQDRQVPEHLEAESEAGEEAQYRQQAH